MGSATAETVAFFSQFRCKLFFAGLVSSPIPESSEEKSDSELVAEFSGLLDFPPGTQFDICLFWDFFSLLDNRSMQAFSTALKPFVGKPTVAHGFGVLNSKTAIEFCDYCVKDFSTILVKAASRLPKKLYHHPRRDFESLLAGFAVEKGTLLQQGKLEVLLEYSERTWNNS